ncbi:MAG: fibrobacter succinogenes major paralogous domain-containing protein [Chitinispirillales bacterium]|nr:fibrobacter succinogenes major paralogous domain-containing protein [Chitinispirillales bacterium]
MYKTFENTQGSAKMSTQKSESNTIVQRPKPSPTAYYETHLTDSRDGKTYRTVVIGAKRWMAENINYQTDNSWCYGDNNSNCGKYGRLYNWNTAMTVCPADWHLPSRQEWKNLINAVGDKKGQGKKLKSKPPIWNGNNAYGFSAMPGGIRESDGRFYNIDYHGYWWTSTENGSSDAYYHNIFYNVADVLEGLNNKSNGFSVRCVQ